MDPENPATFGYGSKKRKKSFDKDGSLGRFVNAYGESLRIWSSLKIFISTWLPRKEGIQSPTTIHKRPQTYPYCIWRVDCTLSTPPAILILHERTGKSKINIKPDSV